MAAARAGDNGLQILKAPLVVARLAGGVLHQVTGEVLELAVGRAREAEGFQELEQVRRLPGMIRAVARTLKAAWNTDIQLIDAAADQPRLRDLALIESRVRSNPPAVARLPSSLRDEALAHGHLGSCRRTASGSDRGVYALTRIRTQGRTCE